MISSAENVVYYFGNAYPLYQANRLVLSNLKKKKKLGIGCSQVDEVNL